MYRFCQDANDMSFNLLLEQMACLETPIFADHIYSEGESIYTINQALEDLFYRKENTFLIFTFDWTICHLSFVCCLLIYWLQIEVGSPVEEAQTFNKNK